MIVGIPLIYPWEGGQSDLLSALNRTKNGLLPLSPDGITQQDQVDIPNYELIIHMKLWTFANLETGGSLAATVYQAEAMINAAPNAAAIDWSVYNGTGVVNQGAAQEPGFALLGSHYAIYGCSMVRSRLANWAGICTTTTETLVHQWSRKREAYIGNISSGNPGDNIASNGGHETVTYAPECSFSNPIELPSSAAGITVTDSQGNTFPIPSLGLNGTSTPGSP